MRVRVLFSKNRLKTDLPRSNGTFFTSRSLTDTKVEAVSRMCVSTLLGQALDGKQVQQLAVLVQLRVAAAQHACSTSKLEALLSFAPQMQLLVTCGRLTRAAVELRPPWAARARPGQRAPPSATRAGPTEIEELVEHGARGAARSTAHHRPSSTGSPSMDCGAAWWHPRSRPGRGRRKVVAVQAAADDAGRALAAQVALQFARPTRRRRSRCRPAARPPNRAGPESARTWVEQLRVKRVR